MERLLARSNMMMSQSSPVEHLIRVMKAAEKDWKLAWTFSSSWGSPTYTFPNSEHPITLNVKRKRIRRRPRELRDYQVSKRV